MLLSPRTFTISLFCDGLYRRLPSYDFVGIMGEQFYDDLRTMGERYGITKELQNVFSFQNKTTNYGVETAASSHVLEYYTPRTVKRALEYLAMDYVMLNLPIPKWAQEMLDETNEFRVYLS